MTNYPQQTVFIRILSVIYKEQFAMKNIILKGGDIYLSENNTDTISVISGNILVYIIPIKENKIGRRSFIYEADKEEILPAFDYVDYEGNRWKLGFTAVDTAKITISFGSLTDEIKEQFAKKAKIRSYANEGFEDGLVEQYQLNIVAEDGFIHKTGQEQKKVYEDSLNIIYNLFYKKQRKTESNNDHNLLYDAVAYACKREHITIVPFSKINESCKHNITMPDIARLSHFICRKVMLPEDWYKSDSGTLIVFDNDSGAPYTCVSKKDSIYYIYNPATKEHKVLTRSMSEKIALDAYMIYRPFENKALTIKDLIKFGIQNIQIKDMTLMLIFMFVGSLIGLLLPTLNQKIYDSYIPLGNTSVLIQVSCIILACMTGNITFSIVKELAEFRMESRIEYNTQSAAYNRLFNLCEDFFRKYDSADLAQRVMSISSFVNSALNMLLGTILSGVFSLVYLFRMLQYSHTLTAASVIMLIIYSIVTISVSLRTIKYSKKSMELSGRASSVMYQFLNGISKIRIAGVEDRALYEYLKPYTEVCRINMKRNRLSIGVSTFAMIAGGLFSLVLYYLMICTNMNISMGTFIAFTSAFSAFSGAMMQVVNSAVSISQLKPFYNRIKPILEATPEYDDNMDLPGELNGDIEISNVTFGYSKDEPVLKDLSLHIKEGEYVGIVGPSGCGKSTLLKLLLGFETPQNGKVFYDKKDIESFDKRELRKKLGVVLQDGKLISGSIYENITITAPDVDMQRVLETVRDVGLEDDINMMPMGLHTVVSEDCGTISGGQQQRILIARAVVGKPKILLFDEATSALDNVTQSMVCKSLEKLNATRVVIAHRLSTVIKCDRIIVMDKGRIIEEGTYSKLMDKHGYFYEIASRQIA